MNLQAASHQVVFLDIEAIGQVAPHSHAEQWGIVVEGEMELTIGGETRRYGPGSRSSSPGAWRAGRPGSLRVGVIDVFGEPERYPKATSRAD